MASISESTHFLTIADGRIAFHGVENCKRKIRQIIFHRLKQCVIHHVLRFKEFTTNASSLTKRARSEKDASSPSSSIAIGNTTSAAGVNRMAFITCLGSQNNTKFGKLFRFTLTMLYEILKVSCIVLGDQLTRNMDFEL